MSLPLGPALQGRVRAPGQPNALFGIVQGGMFEEPAPGIARSPGGHGLPLRRGGVSVGEPKDEMLDIMAHTPHRLPTPTSRAT